MPFQTRRYFGLIILIEIPIQSFEIMVELAPSEKLSRWAIWQNLHPRSQNSKSTFLHSTQQNPQNNKMIEQIRTMNNSACLSMENGDFRSALDELNRALNLVQDELSRKPDAHHDNENNTTHRYSFRAARHPMAKEQEGCCSTDAVSYTHLTLPTKA